MTTVSTIIRRILSRKLFIALIIAVITIAICAPTATYRFVGLDEEDHITNRQNFLHKASSIPDAFTHDSYFPTGFSSHYRPILTLSFMADAAISDANPLGYHITNIALHALVAVILFFVLCELGLSNSAALVWTLLFAVHPAFRQIVAWVPGRNDSILAIFLLLSFLFFMQFVRSSRWLHLAGSILFFALGMFTKETALAFPFVCLAYLLLLKKDFRRKQILTPAIAWIAVFFVWFISRSHALSYINMQGTDAILRNMLSYATSILRYIRVALVPIDLSVMPVVKALDIWIGSGAIAVASIAFMLFGRHAWRRIVFGLIWFFAFLIPTLISSETVTRMAFFEYRLYLPLIGLFFALASIQWDRIIKNARIRIGLVCLFIISLAAITVYESRDMRNSLVFWQSAVRTSSNLARAHDGLGVIYASQNALDDALREHLAAKALAPKDKRISNNIGVIYLRKNMFAQAEAAFKDEIALNPTYAIAHHNLALTYAIQKRWSDAEKEWLVAIELNPWYVLPHQGLAIIYAQFGKIEQSVEHIKKIQELGAPLIPELKGVLEWYEANVLKK